MVKTIRISKDELHKELLKIQGKLQAESGEFTTMDDVIETLVAEYNKRDISRIQLPLTTRILGKLFSQKCYYFRLSEFWSNFIHVFIHYRN